MLKREEKEKNMSEIYEDLSLYGEKLNLSINN